jgi:hypothetical protein
LDTAQKTFTYPNFEKLCGNEAISPTVVHQLDVYTTYEENVKTFLIWLNIFVVIITIVSISYVRTSAASAVDNMVKTYKQLLTHEEERKVRETVDLKNVDTDGSEDTDRADGF